MEEKTNELTEQTEFSIDCDGISLHAKLDRVNGEKPGPLCILIHGFTGNMEEEHLITAQRALNELGISVLRAEMYGHGGSGGTFREHTLYKWVTNALSVVDYARSLDFVTDLYLCGHSQGGLLTMLVGGMCYDIFKAILPLSPAWMIPDTARNGCILRSSYDPLHVPETIVSADGWEISANYVRTARTIHVEDEIERYKGPVLIVQGEADDVVPSAYARKAKELYSNAELVMIPDADHCYAGHMEELAEAIKAFPPLHG